MPFLLPPRNILTPDPLQQQALQKQANYERIRSHTPPDPQAQQASPKYLTTPPPPRPDVTQQPAQPEISGKISYLSFPSPSATPIPTPQPEPDEPAQQRTNYLGTRPVNTMPAPISQPDIMPPTGKPNYLGTRLAALRNVPTSNMTDDTPSNVAANIPLATPEATTEPPSLLGRRLLMTDNRNVSGIDAPPPMAQQSADMNGLANSPKYVRGEQQAPNLLNPQLDPLSQARKEVGDLKPLGFLGRVGQVAKGALLGLGGAEPGSGASALGAALGGGILGGTGVLRKQAHDQQVTKRAGEIGQQRAYERQVMDDAITRGLKEAQTNNYNSLGKDREVKEAQGQEKINQGQQKIDSLTRYRDLSLKARTDRDAANERNKEIQYNLDLISNPNLKPEDRTVYANRLNALGMYIPDNFDPSTHKLQMITNPTTGDVSIVDLNKGTAQGVTGADGKPLIQTPKTTAAEADAQAQARALARMKQDPNAPQGMALSPQAAEFIKNNNLKLNDPSLPYSLKAAGINKPYIPITETEEFNQALIEERAKGSGGQPATNAPTTVAPTQQTTQPAAQQNPNSQPTQTTQTKTQTPQPQPKDLHYYKQNHNKPGIRQRFMAHFGVDPDNLIN